MNRRRRRQKEHLGIKNKIKENYYIINKIIFNN